MEFCVMVKSKRMITEGPIFLRIFTFAVPLMLTAVLQLVYNMADHIVVGQFSGDPTALAAVGSTSSLTNLIVNFIMGMCAGTSVVVAQFYGAGDDSKVSRAVHTSLTAALLLGSLSGVIGLMISEPALNLMGTKPDVLDGAVLYFRIICIGIPAQTLYNFGAAILRAVGDTKTSLIILSCSGVFNVILNLIFVICFDMSVDGVAIATIVAQYVSAVAVVIVLAIRKEESYGFSIKKYRFDHTILGRIMRFGVPNGIQSSLFSVSNVVLTAAANSFETVVVTAKTVAGNIDGVAYTAMDCFSHASLTYTAQNYGAKKPERIKKSLAYALIQVMVVGISISALLFIFRSELSSLFIDSQDPNREIIIKYVEEIMYSILIPYFLCGIMGVLSGTLKGLGYSIAPMIISLAGICGLRLLWVIFVFPLEPLHTIGGLFLCYPVTWSVTIMAFAILLAIAWRKKLKPLELSVD